MASYEEKTQLKRKSSLELLPPDLSELVLVLLGNNWSLKVSVGNLLLGKTEFTQHYKCVKGSGTFKDKPLTVIYSPDQLLTNISKQALKQFIKDLKDLSAPGPQVFLLVLQPEDFTEQHKSRLESVLESFSEKAFHSSLVLMSSSQAETPGTMEKYMSEPHIRDMIIRCRYRYVWMDHSDLQQYDLNPKEFKRKELFTRISDMLKENKEVYLRRDPFEEEDTGLTLDSSTKPFLNLVLFGRTGAGKTFTAESILGRAELPAASSPGQCVKHQGEVCGRQVSLVELPALSGKPQDEVMQKCLQCLSLFGPEGVHAFIRVIAPGSLTKEDKNELEILEKTLSARVRDFTVHLLSVDSDAAAENFSRETCVDLEKLHRKSEGKALHLNIRNQQQVLELIETLDKLSQGGARSYNKDMFMKALIEKVPKSPDMSLSPMSLRIALVGKSGSGKSATANTILGDKCFQPKAARKEENTSCEKVSRMVRGRTVTVLNTPALFDDSFNDEELSKCVSVMAPGPHAFLLLLPIGNVHREDRASLQLIKNRLGEQVADFVMIVFTRGDVLTESYTIENYIEECDEFVKDFLKECKGRYHVLDNINEINNTQVAELVKKIEKMAQENGCFTQGRLEVKELKKQLKEAKIQKDFWLKVCLSAALILILSICIKLLTTQF